MRLSEVDRLVATSGVDPDHVVWGNSYALAKHGLLLREIGDADGYMLREPFFQAAHSGNFHFAERRTGEGRFSGQPFPVLHPLDDKGHVVKEVELFLADKEPFGSILPGPEQLFAEAVLFDVEGVPHQFMPRTRIRDVKKAYGRIKDLTDLTVMDQLLQRLDDVSAVNQRSNLRGFSEKILTLAPDTFSFGQDGNIQVLRTRRLSNYSHMR